MKLVEKYAMPLGMLGIIAYLAHTLLGRLLWPAYNPISTDISSLTADGAPNAGLLRVFTTVYGICMILFAVGLIVKAFRKYHSLVRAGSVILLVMEAVSLFGYALFPLAADKSQMSFQNLMHIVVTAVVVFTTIASGFFLAAGYLRQEHMKKLGRFTLVMAVIITVAGMSTPIGMGAGLNILGLTERMTIYSLQLMLFVLCAYYTLRKDERRELS